MLGEWLYEVQHLLGIGDQQMACFQNATKQFFSPRYLPICYPVGVDVGGNPLVQIAAGRRRGELAMLDHEVFHGGMASLLDVVEGYYPDQEGDEHYRVGFQSFAEASPDEVLEECFKAGYLAHYPVTLKQYLKNLDALYHRIAAANRNRPYVPKPTKAELKAPYLCFPVKGKWRTVEELSTFQGERFTFEPRDAMSWRYKVSMEETRPIRVHIKATTPDGHVLRDFDFTVETNATFQTMFNLAEENAAPLSGTYGIEISFPDDPDLPVLTGSREIDIGKRPLFFTSAKFVPATEPEIAAFEAERPYRLCDDFRAWLATTNGVTFRWPYIKLWAGLLSRDAFKLFEEEVKRVRQDSWELDIQSLTGLQSSWMIWSENADPARWIESPRGLQEDFKSGIPWRYLELLYPVAKAFGQTCYGYCQIAVGAHRGKIAILRHYPTSLDLLTSVQDGQRVDGQGNTARTLEYPFKSFAEATPDQIVEAWVRDGLIELTNMDFAAFSARVLHAHEREFARLFEKYVYEDSDDSTT